MSRSNVKTVLSIASVLALAPFVVEGAPEHPAVVEVRVWTGAGMPERATGTVIAPGRVLTVAHVLEGAERVQAAGEWAEVLRRDAALDLAVLRVRGATGPPVRFGDADGGLRVLTARGGEARGGGEAPGGESTRTGRGDEAGRVVPAQLLRRINARLVDQAGKPRRPSFELVADIVAGDSGAPVIARDGEIAAVVYARSTRRGGAAYAVRTADLAGWALHGG